MKSFYLLIFFFTGFIFPGKKSFTPPGTVKISENLFYDETEITNFHWLEYINWQKNHFGDSSFEYINSLPDTTVWLDFSTYNLPYVSYYFRHPAYRDYPVVGISYEQAMNYCKWRTDRVKEYFKIRNKKADNVPKNFQYCLHTKSEFEMVAKADYSEKTKKKIEKKYKDCKMHNFRQTEATAKAKNDKADVTAPVYSYWENSYGIWNILGNVAEIVSEKGVAKGGGWVHKENDVTIEKDFSYDKQKSWLGFRCVCEILER